MTHVTEQARPNVKNRLVAKKSDSLLTVTPQKIPLLQPAVPNVSLQGLQKKVMKQTVQNRVAVEIQPAKVQPVRPAGSAAPFVQQQTLKIAPVQGKPQEQRTMGTKRTVMQRSNSGSAEQAHLATKVRVIKLSGPVSQKILSLLSVLNHQGRDIQLSHDGAVTFRRKISKGYIAAFFPFLL